jgi:hypothetical protein
MRGGSAAAATTGITAADAANSAIHTRGIFIWNS